MNRLPLTPHARFSAPDAIDLAAGVERTGGGQLDFHFRLEGDIDSLRLPTPQPPERADGLWEHTCFEAFLRPAGRDDYLELNFSPSTRWAVYRFDAYRRGMQAVMPLTRPVIRCIRDSDALNVRVEVGLAMAEAVDLEVGLAAVLEEADGTLSYWALAHAGETPDFHNAGSFVVSV